MNGKAPESETPERRRIVVVFPRGPIEWELVRPGLERNLDEIFSRVSGNRRQEKESEREPEAPAQSIP